MMNKENSKEDGLGCGSPERLKKNEDTTYLRKPTSWHAKS